MPPAQFHAGRTDVGFGSGTALPTLGAVQRASLARGLAVVLSLTLASLMLISASPLGGSGDRAGVVAVRSVAPAPRLP